MGIEFRENEVAFSGMVYEDTVSTLRDYFQEVAPQKIVFDFCECDDIHLASLQIVLAYIKKYGGDYRFGNEVKVYQKVCEGFENSDEHCA
ncbi:MAG: hypothetical protein JZU62_01960 [Sulfuricurvum sp.]|uniref:hypothetical protein n=1 Tax=Sulfuricurvum sp. TaxID=2025608 RepID=UPI0025E4DEC5|nr:hypothetical protein [Sulfuricurvum sp.]MBV5320425.1 hypothetical protein [Sulfuricurvum sp.]